MKPTLNSPTLTCRNGCGHFKNLNRRGFFCYISLKEDCPMKATASSSKRKAIQLIKGINEELIRRGLPVPQEA